MHSADCTKLRIFIATNQPQYKTDTCTISAVKSLPQYVADSKRNVLTCPAKRTIHLIKKTPAKTYYALKVVIVDKKGCQGHGEYKRVLCDLF